MIYRNSRPLETRDERAERAEVRRTAAVRRSRDSRHRPDPSTPANGDNVRFPSRFAAFTKGLAHDAEGFVEPVDHDAFEAALTALTADGQPDSLFEVPTAEAAGVPESCTVERDGEAVRPGFRRWESPLAGHYFALQGPDPADVAIAPAPKVGESELAAEMAEVYAMALVRDMRFDELGDGEQCIYHLDSAGERIGYTRADGSPATVQHLVDELNRLPWFGGGPVTSTLGTSSRRDGLTEHETRRRERRWAPGRRELTVETLFRGDLDGDARGGYLSEFLSLGSDGDTSIAFGAQRIDQRITPVRGGVDYMTSWAEWLDVQNGFALTGYERLPDEKRIADRPRDLAEFVHIDQLYQAYFNACLLLLGANGKPENLFQLGFPNRDHAAGTREGFATFGPPHILSLMTEVASRALKAVRRQKFQIHRRARPERLGAMLTLLANGHEDRFDDVERGALWHLLESLGGVRGERRPSDLMRWVATYNARQNSPDVAACRQFDCSPRSDLPCIDPERNYLLPMAFPEGSPMHPAYGAGHACVAGACVTVLKAFFSAVDEHDVPRTMDVVGGSASLEIGHELDKLASNVSIGRNFAGVHYYTDYHDSLRMGERVAVGMLEEQMFNYTEAVSMNFTSFDGDAMRLETDGGARASSVRLIVDGDASPPSKSAEWWVRGTVEFPLCPSFVLASTGTGS